MKLTLTIVTLIGVVAVAGAIFMGIKSFDGVVVEQPYERGLQWDRENALREQSGLEVVIMSPELTVGRGTLEVLVKGSDGTAYEGPVILRFSRPETTALDRQYEASFKDKGKDTVSGRYEALVELPRHGAWEVSVDLLSGGNTISFMRKVYVRQ